MLRETLYHRDDEDRQLWLEAHLQHMIHYIQMFPKCPESLIIGLFPILRKKIDGQTFSVISLVTSCSLQYGRYQWIEEDIIFHLMCTRAFGSCF